MTDMDMERPPTGESHIGPDHQLPAPEHRPQRSMAARLLIWFLILLAFALLFWWVLRHRAAPKAAGGGRRGMSGPVTLTTVTARKGNIGVYLDAIGTVTPVYTAAITSQVTGMISAVEYHEGQPVRRGQPLIEIDPRPFEAQLIQAQGALERDTNLLAQARMDLARYQEAWNRNAIPRQTLEDQQKIVLQYEGTVKVDQGAVQYDQVQLSYCHITAPISGRLGLRLIDPGNVVQANSTSPLAVITQMQPITVVFTISEDNIGQVEDQVRHGQTLQVTALDRTNQNLIATGKLQTIDNQIDTTTGTLKLRAVFPNQDNALFPNLFVNTRLLVKMLDGVTLISNDAIQQNGNTSYVYVIRNGVAHQVTIVPGVSDNGFTQVTGIQPGDVVADSSFEKLQDNAQVHIAQTAPPANHSRSSAP